MTNATDQRDEVPPEDSTLRKLGSRLADLLDADHWSNIEPMLLAVFAEQKQSSAELTQLRQALAEAERRLDNEKKPCCQQFETCKERCWPLICNLRAQLSTAQAEREQDIVKLAGFAASNGRLRADLEGARLAQHAADVQRLEEQALDLGGYGGHWESAANFLRAHPPT